MSKIIKTYRPISLTIITFICLGVIALTIFHYLTVYSENPYANSMVRKYYLIMIFLQVPILTGVVLMYFLKGIGLWVFLLGKVIFFALPSIAGTDDEVFGLAFPFFFIESSTFFVLFGKRIQYMN